jgi:hypothetical protein
MANYVGHRVRVRHGNGALSAGIVQAQTVDRAAHHGAVLGYSVTIDEEVTSAPGMHVLGRQHLVQRPVDAVLAIADRRPKNWRRW